MSSARNVSYVASGQFPSTPHLPSKPCSIVDFPRFCAYKITRRKRNFRNRSRRYDAREDDLRTGTLTVCKTLMRIGLLGGCRHSRYCTWPKTVRSVTVQRQMLLARSPSRPCILDCRLRSSPPSSSCMRIVKPTFINPCPITQTLDKSTNTGWLRLPTSNPQS